MASKRYLAALILAAAMAGLILSGMAAHAAKAVYTYDNLGRLATVSNTADTSTFVYDKVGNIMYADGSPLPVASVYPLSLDFGTIYINNTTEARKVTFYNHGISNVTITNTVITGADAAIADGNIMYALLLAVNAGSTTDTTGYAALDPSEVLVTNLDDEAGGGGGAAL